MHDDREFLTLEELKPHHLTELGGQPPQNSTTSRPLADDFQLNQGLEQDYNVYYDLNAQQSK